MPNDQVPAPIFGGKVDVTDMKSLAQRAKTSADNNPRGGGAPNGSDYLNFSGKRGVFTIGEKKRSIQDDERWVVDVTSFEEGWVCWKSGRPAHTRMSNIYTGVPVQQPAPDESGPFDTGRGEGWFQAKAMVMKSCDEDQQGYFKINSVSGVGEMADLMEAFSERAAQGVACWPVVCLEAEEFEAQGYKNFKPIFVVQGWLNNDQLAELADGGDIDELLDGNEAPKAIDKKPAPEPQPEPKPSGRRRARK